MAGAAEGNREGNTELNRLLASLLLERKKYKRQWRAHSGKRITNTGLDQAAVAKVLEAYAWDKGIDTSYRSLKSTVSRALGPNPRTMTGKTLELFMGAFDMSPADQDRLMEVAHRKNGITFLDRHEHVNIPYDPPRSYRTVRSSDTLILGPDGTPQELRTNVALEATETMTYYPFIFHAGVKAVRLLRGCGEVGPTYPHKDLKAVNIKLERPAKENDNVILEFVAECDYSQTEVAAQPWLRRATSERGTDILELRVEFHPECLPDGVWWSTWSSLDGEALTSEPWDLDGQNAAWRLVRDVGKSISGFRWSLPAGSGAP